MDAKGHVVAEPIRASIAVLIMRLIVALVVPDAIYFILRVVFFDLNMNFIPRPFEFTILIILLFIFYIIQISLVIFIVLSWIGVAYFIESMDIIVRKGILHIHEEAYPIRDVKAVSVDQSPLGKLFNYGTVNVMIASPPVHEEISLVDIPNPHTVEARIKSFL